MNRIIQAILLFDFAFVAFLVIGTTINHFINRADRTDQPTKERETQTK